MKMRGHVKKYICPMHSDVKTDRPGRCPRCGMNLEVREEEKRKNK